MTPNYNKIHHKFKLNAVHYNFNEFKDFAHYFIEEGQPFEKTIGEFLCDWLNGKDYVLVNTSGSTGKPKSIKIKKKAMVNSAIATGEFFKLKAGDSALHVLPTNFIAGKMMLVRAMVLGLEIDVVEPTSNLKFDTKKHYTFSAMVPLQLQNNIENISNIETVIVGGAAVSKPLFNVIQTINSVIYETYGMTETVTHIAVKQLNNFRHAELVSASHFKTLPNVSISQDKRDCLIIEAPKLSEEKIVTNDIVKLHSKTEFVWLGRFDNVINSGGLKLFPEQIEAKLQDIIKQRFFVASEKNEILGEQLILIIEGKPNIDVISNATRNLMTLDKYEKPKQVYTVSKFIETTSGKIQRKKTLELLNI